MVVARGWGGGKETHPKWPCLFCLNTFVQSLFSSWNLHHLHPEALQLSHSNPPNRLLRIFQTPNQTSLPSRSLPWAPQRQSLEPPSSLNELCFISTTGLVIYGLTSLTLLLDFELLERSCILSLSALAVLSLVLSPCLVAQSSGGTQAFHTSRCEYAPGVQHCCSGPMADSQYLFVEWTSAPTNGWVEASHAAQKRVCLCEDDSGISSQHQCHVHNQEKVDTWEVCLWRLRASPVSFCTSSQANALWRGVPVSTDIISADK